MFCRIIDDSNKEISALRASVDDGNCIPQFGAAADQICNSVRNISLLVLIFYFVFSKLSVLNIHL